METVVQNDATINQKLITEENQADFMAACKNGDYETAKLLLKNGANINKADKYQRTPLYVACRYGYLEVVKLLIQKGAYINGADGDQDQETPLHASSKYGHLEVIKLLLKNGADINKSDERQITPFSSKNLTTSKCPF